MSVSKNDENALKRAMDGQNNIFLTNTTLIPIIGLSFEASLKTDIAVGKLGNATIESIIYQHCLSLEPTTKSHNFNRFNLICLRTDTDVLLEFIKTDIPQMWTLLPGLPINSNRPFKLHTPASQLVSPVSRMSERVASPLMIQNLSALHPIAHHGNNHLTSTDLLDMYWSSTSNQTTSHKGSFWQQKQNY